MATTTEPEAVKLARLEGQVGELSKGVHDLRTAQRQTFWAVVAIGVAQFSALMGILAALVIQLA